MTYLNVRTPEQIRASVEAEKRSPEARKYDVTRYFRPSVAVDLVVFTAMKNQLQVMLVERKDWPFKGRWALPGGFVREHEGLMAAAKRELEEETGVSDVYLEQLRAFGDPDRDPRTRVITVAHYALILSERLRMKASGDAGQVRWWSVYELPELAFDHDVILELALTRLRSQIMSSRVAFRLLPEKFTLTEIQKLYEIILGKTLDKRNFRKKILSAGVVIETDETVIKGRHRPARLFRFNPEMEE